MKERRGLKGSHVGRDVTRIHELREGLLLGILRLALLLIIRATILVICYSWLLGHYYLAWSRAASLERKKGKRTKNLTISKRKKRKKRFRISPWLRSDPQTGVCAEERRERSQKGGRDEGGRGGGENLEREGDQDFFGWRNGEKWCFFSPPPFLLSNFQTNKGKGGKFSAKVAPP